MEKFGDLEGNAKEKEKSAPQAKKNLYCMCTKPSDGPGAGAAGHQLAVVACRDGRLYCMCTKP